MHSEICCIISTIEHAFRRKQKYFWREELLVFRSAEIMNLMNDFDKRLVERLDVDLTSKHFPGEYYSIFSLLQFRICVFTMPNISSTKFSWQIRNSQNKKKIANYEVIETSRHSVEFLIRDGVDHQVCCFRDKNNSKCQTKNDEDDDVIEMNWMNSKK